MRKISGVRKTDWQAFTATVPEELCAWETRASSRFPNWILVTIGREDTWQLAKASGFFLTMPAPWCSASRLPIAIQTTLGRQASTGETIGDYFEAVLGRDIFLD
jgi:hypothetical protein